MLSGQRLTRGLPPPPSSAGSVQLGLIVDATSSGPFAKCYTQVVVSVDGSTCAVTVTPIASNGVYLNRVFTSASVAGYQAQYQAW